MFGGKVMTTYQKFKALPIDHAAAIGVIGGADGPTAVFVGAQTPKLHAVCSSLHFEPVGEVEWRAVFSEKLMEDLDICLM